MIPNSRQVENLAGFDSSWEYRLIMDYPSLIYQFSTNKNTVFLAYHSNLVDEAIELFTLQK